MKLNLSAAIKEYCYFYGSINSPQQPCSMKSKWQTSSLELQKMLFDIESGKIDLVMVSEISRISRNMKDFSEIWELMKKNNCGFYSLRENFDTTTAAGEMVLYTIANIAQFERRLVSE